MSLSDIPFAYGPFVPHHVPKQYIENYFSAHKLDTPSTLSLNTTVEDLSLIHSSSKADTKDRKESWKLTLRKYDVLKKVDVWWEEQFDAVVLANGHYAVPFVGLS
jgi:cation diffusion facilitator CzcD-associated flavoprotein CzcO